MALLRGGLEKKGEVVVCGSGPHVAKELFRRTAHPQRKQRANANHNVSLPLSFVSFFFFVAVVAVRRRALRVWFMFSVRCTKENQSPPPPY